MYAGPDPRIQECGVYGPVTKKQYLCGLLTQCVHDVGLHVVELQPQLPLLLNE